jgi:hypothetical protein
MTYLVNAGYRKPGQRYCPIFDQVGRLPHNLGPGLRFPKAHTAFQLVHLRPWKYMSCCYSDNFYIMIQFKPNRPSQVSKTKNDLPY